MSSNMDKDPDKAPNYAHWVAEDALKNISMERALNGHETHAQLARRLLEENSPMAVARIVHMALRGDDDRISFMATKYIVDQSLGTPTSTNQSGSIESPIEQVMGAVLIEANNIVNENR